MQNNAPTILITAYAVNPYKGSEDGTGWNMIKEIAKYNKVIAITRENNQKDIEKYLMENALPQGGNITFAYFDLPYWMRFWKKGGRGALLYYYLWQIGIVFFILKKKFQYDALHQLNFHNDWTPSFLWLLRKPLFWGPIGHHPAIPKNYLVRSAGQAAYYFDRLKWWTKKFFWNFDPFLKITKWRAAKIFTINSSVQPILNFNKEKEIRMPAVATENVDLHNNTSTNEKFTVLSIGRFVPLKGFDVTIEAFAHFYQQQTESDKKKLELVLIGKGPQKRVLQKLAHDLKILPAVRFIEWMSKKELDAYFRSSSAFLFPSHEGAGMVVPEALSYGLPVLCYDNIGPGEFVNHQSGMKAEYSNPQESIISFTKFLQLLFHEKDVMRDLSIGARERFESHFTWERKGKVMSQAYLDVLFPYENRKIEQEEQPSNNPILISSESK